MDAEQKAVPDGTPPAAGVVKFIRITPGEDGYDQYVHDRAALVQRYQNEPEADAVMYWTADALPGCYLRVREDIVFAVNEGTEIVRINQPVVETRRIRP